jgi:hypothetical protein
MPFRLTNAPSTFQALLNDVFRDYVDKFMLVYLDDVLIFDRSAEEHKEHVELVLKRLRDVKQFAKLSKCEFNKAVGDVPGTCCGSGGVEYGKVERGMCFTVAASDKKARGPVVFGICQLLSSFHQRLCTDCGANL